MKISEAFEMYRNDYMKMKNMSVSLLRQSYYHQNSLISFLGDIEISSIKVSDIGKWFIFLSKERGQNTVRNYICSLRSLIGYCNLRGENCINKDLIPVPKRLPNIPEFLTAKEVSKMIDCACNLRAKFIISLFYSSGIRLSELISLNKGQIKDRKFSVIGKGGKARLCFIDSRTEKLMNAYLKTREDACEALIVSIQNKARMTQSNIQLIISNAAKNAGFNRNITPHTLRHSFATNLMQNGLDIRYIAKLMGHSSINTTAIYTHVIDIDLEKKYRKNHTI